MSLSVYLPYVCKCLWKPEYGIQSSRERITESGEQPCRCWDLTESRSYGREAAELSPHPNKNNQNSFEHIVSFPEGKYFIQHND